jgi:hypothetical protein
LTKLKWQRHRRRFRCSFSANGGAYHRLHFVLGGSDMTEELVA